MQKRVKNEKSAQSLARNNAALDRKLLREIELDGISQFRGEKVVEALSAAATGLHVVPDVSFLIGVRGRGRKVFELIAAHHPHHDAGTEAGDARVFEPGG